MVKSIYTGMWKEFLNRRIHLSIALIILICICIMAIAAFFEVKTIVYNYAFSLPGEMPGGSSFAYGSWPALDNVDFYHQVFSKLIGQKTTFINADLSFVKARFL